MFVCPGRGGGVVDATAAETDGAFSLELPDAEIEEPDTAAASRRRGVGEEEERENKKDMRPDHAMTSLRHPKHCSRVTGNDVGEGVAVSIALEDGDRLVLRIGSDESEEAAEP